jgi:alpha-tubulin suppressor-like RCC1 family protein
LRTGLTLQILGIPLIIAILHPKALNMLISNNPLIIGAAECFGELVFKRSMGLIGTTLSFVLAITLTSAPFASATENPVAPGPPTSLQLVSKTATSLTLSWTAPANDGGSPITDYIVEYSTDGTNWTTFNDGTSTTTSASITDLTRGSAYQLRVKAANSHGNGASSLLNLSQILYGNETASAGAVHTCAILADGTVNCWGYNQNGQLGDGTITSRLTPVSVSGITPANPAVSIAAGFYHTCAILSDGTVKCWGYNDNGQLGDGTITSRLTPVSVSGITPANPAVSITAGFKHTCGILADGTVKCWGSNNIGQLGDGTITSRLTPVSVSGITSVNPAVTITAGELHTCGILADGTVKCWGSNNIGQLGDGTITSRLTPVNVSGITSANPAVSISAGKYQTCVFLADGTVKCWGSNDNGQLGDGTLTSRLTPVNVSGITSANPAVSITAGFEHACGILTDGTVKCWGSNDNGELGDGTINGRTAPVSVSGITSANPAVSITAGWDHTCAIFADGTVKCWGQNNYGNLGDGTTAGRTAPVSVSGITVSNSAVSYVITAEVPSEPSSLISTGKTATSVSLSWTAPTDNGGRSITDYVIQYATSITENTTWTTFNDGISAATSTNVIGLSRGTSYYFRLAAVNPEGASMYLELAGSVTPSVAPSPPTALQFVSKTATSLTVTWTAPIDNGGSPVTDYIVEYSTDGSSWTTFNEEVSSETTVTINELTQGASYMVRIFAVNSEGTSRDIRLNPESLLNKKMISTHDHSCAIVAGGLINCWGNNDKGQLGDGTTTNRMTPVNVLGISSVNPAVSVSTGSSSSCALLADGTLKCWGANTNGQLGDGTISDRKTPVNVSGISSVNPAVSVSMGSIHTCALLADGTVKCWGWNSFGQIGDGTTTHRSTPVSVLGISSDNRATSISAGAYHNCATFADGTVKCWGYNDLAQIGDGSRNQRNTPVSVSGISSTNPATSISTGYGNSCALLTDGNVKCWGWNGYGQIGDGTNTLRTVPVSVVGINSENRAVSVSSSGNDSTCALLADGIVKCWGNNGVGQLGDGTLINRYTPVTVSGISSTNRAVSISLGGSNACAILENGTVKCWGWNSFGQIGDGTTTQRTVPVSVPGIDLINPVARELIPASFPSMITGLISTGKTANSVSLSWSAPYDGGRPITDYRIQYASNPGLTWTTFNDSVSTSTSTTVTGLSSGSPYIFQVAAINAEGLGAYSTTPAEVIPDVVPRAPQSLQLVSKTATSLSLSWNGPVDNGGSPVTDYLIEYSTDGANWTTFSDGFSNTNSVTITGLTRGDSYDVRVRALNLEGIGSAAYVVAPGTAVGISASKSSHTCAVFDQGTVKCWGSNNFGQLGDGTGISRVNPVSVSEISSAVAVTTGTAGYSCALLSSGGVKCWGNNANGQLGDGTTIYRSTPVNVSGISDATAISAGYSHTCALLSSGLVKCWGDNSSGGLGDGTYIQRLSPVSVSGINTAVSLSSGWYNTCTTLLSGEVKCWGLNSVGQLGNGTLNSTALPTSVTGISNAKLVSLYYHGCALLYDGSIKCWGHNNDGRIGDGTTTQRRTPVLIAGISSAISVSAGDMSTCAVTSDSTLKCWGANTNGQIGDGTNTQRLTPTLVSSLTNLKSVSVGSLHACATLNDGSVKCWGANSDGHLGDGTTIQRHTPVNTSWEPSPVSLIPAESPGVPGQLISLGKTTTSTTLSWSAPADNGGREITDYKIRYSSNAGSTWTMFTDAISAETSTTVTGLISGTSYVFQVAALNHEGVGYFSNSSLGVIPNIVPNAPTSLALVSKSTNSISLSWRAPIENGGTAVADYKVEYSTDGSNWSTFSDGVSTATSATITGLIRGTSYQVRVKALNQEGLGEEALLTSLIPATAPTRPLGLLVTGHSNSTVDLNWSTPTDNGGLPLSSYGIWYSTNSGQTWTLYGNTNGPVNAVTVESLTRGTSYVFRVAASNEDGYGEFSNNSSSVIPAELPGVPTSPKLVTRGTGSVAISWTAPIDSGGRGITGYKVRLSSDQGLTWGNPLLTTSNVTAFTIPNIPIASARLVQLAAVTAEGTGEWSDALYVTTKGARAMSVKLLDAASKPISGGQVTWRMVDNSAWSSKVYGLTADGLIEFPYAPAGLVNVTLRDGVLADGTLVSGTWQTVIGYSSTTLKTPRLDLLSKRLVRTIIPGGLPVANVAVTVNDDEVTKKVTVSGFTFETDTLRTSGVTDPNGDFLVVGYWNETPTANLIYDDGVITQQQNVELAEATTRVELDYMPWVTFDSSAVTGTEGAQTNIAISVKDIDGESMSSLLNESPQAVASTKVVSIPKSGVTVRLIAPAGATGKCTVKGKKEKLSGISGTNGKVTLTICPSVSGEYKLSTSGGAPIGKVLLRVNGAPSLPVTAVSVSSPAIGKARISWNPPSFLGGAPITSYTVVAKATGKTTVTKVVTSSTRLVTLTGLANGTTYTISITAKTKNGTSIAVVKKLPVA